MKLAEIAPSASLEYAQKNGLIIKEYITFSEFPQIVSMFNTCVAKAREEGCVEVVLHEVKDHFNLMNEKHNWRLSVIGFLIKK